MKVDDILSQSSFFMINKKMALEIGLKESLLLSILIDGRKIFGEEGFFQTTEKIESISGINPKQQLSAFKKLEELNFISIKYKGLPRKRFFFINDSFIMEFLGASLVSPKWTDWQSQNGLTSESKMAQHNKEHNYKEHNYKKTISNKRCSDYDYTEDFEKLWNDYLKKGDKQKAFKAFKKLTSEEISEVQKIANFLVSERERQFLPALERLLTQKGTWESFKYEMANDSDKTDKCIGSTNKTQQNANNRPSHLNISTDFSKDIEEARRIDKWREENGISLF